MAGQKVPTMVRSKRRHDDYGEVSKKRPRSSLEQDSQVGYSTSSDIFGLQVHELLDNLEAEANANLQRVTGLLKQLKVAIEGLPPREPLLVRRISADEAPRH